ncbi:MAG: exodeoxyribonuclease III [Chloroflexi bacterium]|nr:exodeoxyribonuclease III [Chloroflexota bacterium]
MGDSSVRLATFNANSIRVRLPQILAWLQANEIDLLGVQETKVTDEEFPEAEIRAAGYDVTYAGQKAYAGVAVISRGALEDVVFGLGDAQTDVEPRTIRGSYRGIRIINTYVPQGRDIASEHFQFKLGWLARVRALLESDYRRDEALLWMGDLNVAPEPIDVYDPKALAEHVDFHPAARAALAAVVEWGLVDVLRKHHPEAGQYTYYDFRVRNSVQRGMGWRIDHLLASPPLAERSLSAWIDTTARLAERPSDHTFLAAEFSP